MTLRLMSGGNATKPICLVEIKSLEFGIKGEMTGQPLKKTAFPVLDWLRYSELMVSCLMNWT